MFMHTALGLGSQVEAASQGGPPAARASSCTQPYVRPCSHQSCFCRLQVDVMLAALRAKFGSHPGPRALLLASAGRRLVEASPNDFFWGAVSTTCSKALI